MVNEKRLRDEEPRRGYYESEDHVPDHTAMSGTLDTTDTAGPGGHAKLENLAPIFRVARAHDLAYAARAVDPNDTEVSEDAVQLSTGLSVVQGDPEADKKRVAESADEAQRRLDPGYSNAFDEDRRFTYDRRVADERSWAVRVADMDAAQVVGGNEYRPVAPPEEAPEEPAQEDKTNPEVRQEEKQAATEGESAETPSESPQEPAEEPEEVPPTQEPTPEPEPVQEPQTPAAEPEYKTPDGDVKAPNKASSKTEWVDWAVACGAPRDAAEAQSRLQLITQFGKYRPTEKK
jgi:hypothetical protein